MQEINVLILFLYVMSKLKRKESRHRIRELSGPLYEPPALSLAVCHHFSTPTMLEKSSVQSPAAGRAPAPR